MAESQPEAAAIPAMAAAATAAPNASSAANRVFDIPELLENMLLKVTDPSAQDEPTGLRTVLLSQRVSKTFNATINGSSNILRALWMRPRTELVDAVRDQGFNPLLKNGGNGIPFLAGTPYRIVSRHAERESQRLNMYFILNKLKAADASWKRMLILSGVTGKVALDVMVFEDEESFSRFCSGGGCMLGFEIVVRGHISAAELVERVLEIVGIEALG